MIAHTPPAVRMIFSIVPILMTTRNRREGDVCPGAKVDDAIVAPCVSPDPAVEGHYSCGLRCGDKEERIDPVLSIRKSTATCAICWILPFPISVDAESLATVELKQDPTPPGPPKANKPPPQIAGIA